MSSPRKIPLEARRAQPGNPVSLKGGDPTVDFLVYEVISAANLFNRNRSVAQSRENHGLAARHPALTGQWQRNSRFGFPLFGRHDRNSYY